MGRPCKCCEKNRCYCLSGRDPLFSTLTFNSSDGLHPVSFSSNIYVAPKTNPILNLNNIRANAGSINPACNYATANNLLAPVHNFLDRLRSVNESQSPCCLEFVAYPETYCRSNVRHHTYKENESQKWSINIQKRYAIDSFWNNCGTGWKDFGTTTYNYVHDEKASYAAYREVFGVRMTACLTTLNGQPKIKLIADVYYKDWLLIPSSVRSGIFKEYTGYSAYQVRRFTGPFGMTVVCITSPGNPGWSYWTCGTFAGSNSFTPYTEIPDVNTNYIDDCESCPERSGTWYYQKTPLNCNVEMVSREIYIDPYCSLDGSYTFPSGLAVTPKYTLGRSRCQNSLLNTVCDNPIMYNCPESFDTISLPTENSTVDIILNPFVGGDADFTFDLRRTTTTIIENYTTSHSNNGNGIPINNPEVPGSPSGYWLLMNWWTEDWVITIS